MANGASFSLLALPATATNTKQLNLKILILCFTTACRFLFLINNAMVDPRRVYGGCIPSSATKVLITKQKVFAFF